MSDREKIRDRLRIAERARETFGPMRKPSRAGAWVVGSIDGKQGLPPGMVLPSPWHVGDRVSWDDGRGGGSARIVYVGDREIVVQREIGGDLLIVAPENLTRIGEVGAA